MDRPLKPDEVASQCSGKATFATPQLAHRVNRRRRIPGMQVYRCQACGLFHIGSPLPKFECKSR